MFPDAQQERLKLGSLFVRHEQPPHFAEFKPSYRIGRQRGHTFVVCATLSQERKTVKVSAESATTHKNQLRCPQTRGQDVAA